MSRRCSSSARRAVWSTSRSRAVFRPCTHPCRLRDLQECRERLGPISGGVALLAISPRREASSGVPGSSRGRPPGVPRVRAGLLPGAHGGREPGSETDADASLSSRRLRDAMPGGSSAASSGLFSPILLGRREARLLAGFVRMGLGVREGRDEEAMHDETEDLGRRTDLHPRASAIPGACTTPAGGCCCASSTTRVGSWRGIHALPWTAMSAYFRPGVPLARWGLWTGGRHPRLQRRRSRSSRSGRVSEAGSIALYGFGLDSVIESGSGSGDAVAPVTRDARWRPRAHRAGGREGAQGDRA